MDWPNGIAKQSTERPNRDFSVIREIFNEQQVFRIDHYMGKEAVQNILAFRFANSMVERAWSGDAVDHVQISIPLQSTKPKTRSPRPSRR